MEARLLTTLRKLKPFKNSRNVVANHPFRFVKIMDTNSIIFPLAVTFEQPPMPILPMNLKGVRLQGSLVASRQNLRDLLKFAAQKKITATVMKYPLNIEGIEAAMQDLRDGKVRYRAVLVRDLKSDRYQTSVL